MTKQEKEELLAKVRGAIFITNNSIVFNTSIINVERQLRNIEDIIVRIFDKVETNNDTLTASEALYAFVGWLTGRKEKVTLSSGHAPGNVVLLIEEFCKQNSLQKPRENWADNIITMEE